MFGYVTPLKDELRVKEYQFYQSTYCGLCHCMGKKVCNTSRMTLSYDMVFLALVRFALTGENIEFDSERCVASPLKKKVTVAANNSLEYCAGAGALLAYYKIADDADDKKGIRKIAAKMALIFSGRMRRKAKLPQLDKIIAEKLKKLSEYEKKKDSDISADEAASLFGELLRSVFEEGLDDDKRRIAGEIGFHIGKWIYLVDAADDFTKDNARGEYNPLPEDIDKESLRCAMRLELEAAAYAYELFPAADSGINAIIRNILYLGLPVKADEVLLKLPEKDNSGITERKTV